MPYQLGQFWIRPSELVLLYRFLSVFEAVVCVSSIPLRISPRDAGKSNALGTTRGAWNNLPAGPGLAPLPGAFCPVPRLVHVPACGVGFCRAPPGRPEGEG